MNLCSSPAAYLEINHFLGLLVFLLLALYSLFRNPVIPRLAQVTAVIS